jgi:exopolysaccharide production protein ExoZ
MRGVAACAVVFAHVVDLILERGSQMGEPRLISLGYVADFGAVGVDLFFVISGFVMAMSVCRLSGTRGATKFLVLREVRIAPPYLAVCAVLVAYRLAKDGVTPTWRSVWNAVAYIPVWDVGSYTEPPLTIGWTLSFEFAFYVVVAAMIVVNLNDRLLYLVGLFLATAALGMVWSTDVYVVDWVLSPMMLEFGLGIIAYTLWSQGTLRRLRRVWWLAVLIGASALLVELFVGYGDVSDADRILDSDAATPRVVVWGLPMFLIFSGLIARGERQRHPRWDRLPKLLGDASYSIYLVHLLPLIVLGAVVERLPGPVPPDAALLACFGVAVAAGVVYYKLVEAPVTERLRTVVARRLDSPRHLPVEEPPA